MFEYTDPVRAGVLESQGALTNYRAEVHSFYRSGAREPDSAFTVLSAFEGLGEADGVKVDTISWSAFPKTSQLNDATIDANRSRAQDEYVEWRVERENGRVSRIVFTTEFSEYYEALATVSATALIQGIQEALPGATSTVEELFGPGFDPDIAQPSQRAIRFRNQTTGRFFDPTVRNPWNNNQKGILCLSQPANTLGALFGLVIRCAVPNPAIDPTDTCGNVGNACGPGRNSDPVICTAAQNVSRTPRVLSVADPVGVRILGLSGIWKINGQQVDINDPDHNQGAWTISRNGRRAVLDVSKGVTIVDEPITTGAQVSRSLFVSVDVISAPEEVVPEEMRTGNETRLIL